MDIRTIVVEDDPMVLHVNKEYIGSIPGFLVVATATSCREALDVLNEYEAELMILDIYLPDGNGVSLLKTLRSRNNSVDVILVTAARDGETIQNVFRYGAIDFIIKPFKFDRLKAALESYRNLWVRLQNASELDQEDLDHLLKAGSGPVASLEKSLPKGLNRVTLKQVLSFLNKQKVSCSAEDVAEGLGVSRVTARRYLDYLEKSGQVKLEIQYGSVGRPVNRYRS